MSAEGRSVREKRRSVYPALRVAGLAALLALLNLSISGRLFAREFLASMNSGEGVSISLARWFMHHPSDARWLPIWYGGMPLSSLGSAGIPFLAAGVGLMTGWSAQHAYHFLAACAYILAPLALFLFCIIATQRRLIAFAAGLLASLFSASCFLIPAVRHDTGDLLGGRTFALIVRYGCGPHTAALALSLVFLTTLHLAMTSRPLWARVAAPFLLSGVILIDWVAGLGLAAALGGYLLSRAGSGARIHWPTLAAVLGLGLLFILPWFPPSTAVLVFSNVRRFDPDLLNHATIYAFVLLDVLLVGLHIVLRKQRADPWFRFFCFLTLIDAMTVLGRRWFGWHLAPQSDLFVIEFDFAACALAAYIFAALFYRGSRWLKAGLAVTVGAACVCQYVALERYAAGETRPVDIGTTAEHRMAHVFESRAAGQRIFAPGNVGSWTNAFTDNPQLSGCCDEIMPAGEYATAMWAVATGQNAGDRDASISVLWLKAYGVDSIGVTPENFWKPKKFEGTLEPIWSDGKNTVYDVGRRFHSLAYVVRRNEYVSHLPENGLDTEVISPYVSAIEGPGAKPAQLTWRNNAEAHIEANVQPGELISVQINHHRGWRASANGHPRPVFADGLGLMVIDPNCNGPCSVNLRWESGREAVVTKSLQIGGGALFIAWIIIGRRRLSFRVLKKAPWLLPAIFGLALGVLLVRSAWIAEDGYITFRVVDNLLNGYGLRWNIADRVQVFTDPLFVGILACVVWLFGHIYFSAIALSIAFTICAYALIVRGTTVDGVVLASIVLVLSKGFVDFSVSGLENPATHLAIATYLFIYWRKRDPLLLSLMAALAAANRMDAALFFLPSLLGVYWRSGKTVWRKALIGWSPFLIWCTFALFYYGFLFPNTAYAKLNLGFGARDLIWQGELYFLNAWRWNTTMLVGIAIGLFVCLYAREWLLALGVILNLIYVLRVGGDYMSGRFLTGACFFCAGLIARYWKFNKTALTAALGVVIASGLTIPAPTITSAIATFGAPRMEEPVSMVSDERAYWYPCSGLLKYLSLPEKISYLPRPDNPHYYSCSGPPQPEAPIWPNAFLARLGYEIRQHGASVGVYHTIGMLGYFGGPNFHLVDEMALGDALIARLQPPPGRYRPGHYLRTIPKGYLETVQTGKNLIEDPNLAAYYGHLQTVISGDLWDWDRIVEIYRFNAGKYDGLLRRN